MKPKKIMTQDEISSIRKEAHVMYVQDGMTAKEISKSTGISENTLSHWVNNFGWKSEKKNLGKSGGALLEFESKGNKNTFIEIAYLRSFVNRLFPSYSSITDLIIEGCVSEAREFRKSAIEVEQIGIDVICQSIYNEYGVTEAEISVLSHDTNISNAKSMLALLVDQERYNGSTIAKILNLSLSAVSQRLRTAKGLLSVDKQFKASYTKIMQVITKSTEDKL